MKRAATAVVLFALLSAGCSDDTPSRQETMTSLADATFIPQYQAVVASTTDLSAKTRAACATPTPERVAVAAAAVDNTRAAWSRTEAMWAGPVMTNRSWALIDYPVNPTDIDKNIANPVLSVFDVNTVGRRVAADERGLGAIEFLLPTATDPRRCEYAASAAEVTRSEAQRIRDLWLTGTQSQPPYRDTFRGSAEGADIDKSVDAVVNDSINLLRKMGDTELGGALGTSTRAADVAAIPEGPSGRGVDIALARLDGIEAVLTGSPNKPGLSPLLAPDLRTRVIDQITAARNALQAIDGSLRAAVATNRPAVENAKVELDRLRTLVSTEVVSALGATVGFSDQDGDSAG